MKDIIPNISDSDVKRIIARDFSEVEFAEIDRTLAKYQSESQKGMNRVYAAILKLAGGDLGLLEEYTEKAIRDFRDVITLSETPSYTERAFDDDLSENEMHYLINADWKQYQEWLNK
jgi:hypothetical protein